MHAVLQCTQSCQRAGLALDTISPGASTALTLSGHRAQVSLFTAERKLADPCTFRILVRNLTILLPEDDELRQRAYSTLNVRHSLLRV